jgi:hypothetical protein
MTNKRLAEDNSQDISEDVTMLPIGGHHFYGMLMGTHASRRVGATMKS